MPLGFDLWMLVFVPEGPSRIARRFKTGCALGLLTGLSFFLTATSGGQTFGPKGIKGFKAAEPYGPPHETQTKSLLEGGRALPLGGGRFLVSEGVILRTFSETNTPQLVVRGRDCIYNSTNHSADSAGPIQMQTADGRFAIEGEGFYWQQTNSCLIISNNVHTTIQADLLEPSSTNRFHSPSQPDTGPLFISSDRFKYDNTSGQGVWSDHVNVTGTNLALASEVLTAIVPMAERQVHSLLAEKNVIVDYGGLHATGGRMSYAPDNGLVRLADHPTWRADQREGRGDELIIDRTNRVFQVAGHAWLNLRGQALGKTGFLSFSNSPSRQSSSSATSSVEIVCDNYEIRTNYATFRDQVRLEEHVDHQERGHMACNLMTVTFAGTNELQTMIAEKDVIIEEGDKRFTGGRAVYTQTNTTLEMTHHPKWWAGLREGKGGLLRLNTQQNEMLVRSNAYMRLPANDLAGQFSPTNLTGTSNHPAKSGTNQFAEIFSEEYTLSTNLSVFRGGVYVTHPEMNWAGEKLTVELSAAGTTNMVAEGNVVFDFISLKGKFHGTGDKAVYSFGVVDTVTNGAFTINELRLTGTPATLTNTDRTLGFQNNLIIWDRAKDKLSLPGDYKIQGEAKPVNTNIFLLPNKKLTK